MKIVFLTFAVIIISLFGPVEQTVSQEKAVERTWGLSALIQGGQLDIILPIWAGNKAVIAPAFNVVYVEDAGVDLGIGIAPRFYLRMDKVAPYISGRVGAFFNLPSGNAEETTDWLLGLAFGGEYFLNTKFSIGVEAQANFAISDDLSSRFGNPGGLSLNTATAVFASIYF
jgi:hypothetical protein